MYDTLAWVLGENDSSPYGCGPQKVTMDPEEFRRLLRRALGLPEDASEYAMLAQAEVAYHFYLLNRPAPVVPEDGGDSA